MTPRALDACARRAPASAADVSNVERRLGRPLPPEYRALLLESDGLEGFVAPDAYLCLWRVSELPAMNKAYAVAECLPGITLFGTDGGDTAYGFRYHLERVEYLRTPLVGLGPASVTVMGATLREFVEQLRHVR